MHFVPLDLGNPFRPLSQTSRSGFGDIEFDRSKNAEKGHLKAIKRPKKVGSKKNKKTPGDIGPYNVPAKL